MALLKVACCCVVLGLVRAGPLLPVGQEPEPFDPNPQYSYSYSIQDAVTGDSKSQSETRNGDVVQGQYSVVDADGTRRIVDYTADAIHGFNAVVRREGTPSLVHATTPAVVRAAPAVVARAVVPPVITAAPPSFVRGAPFVQYSSPRFSYSVQPVAVASTPVARYAPAPFTGPLSNHITGASGVHTSVSTPYHSYSY
ncbi:larval cuticle protein A3A-like [Frankliniella occidentalis]|uniref:Larval cuticle protein A3A-like n=1 Tax=Frankliniella occidentalis TaxID=133901 RepID=A0A6J1RVI7_FRAOC|nr:larval cuticle protein A3A-like [Frankliniella occidentalis]